MPTIYRRRSAPVHVVHVDGRQDCSIRAARAAGADQVNGIAWRPSIGQVMLVGVMAPSELERGAPWLS
jgi:hypothetical protein